MCIVHAAALVGLAQSSYSIDEAGGNISVCVVFVGDSGIDVTDLAVDITVTATAATATGDH